MCEPLLPQAAPGTGKTRDSYSSTGPAEVRLSGGTEGFPLGVNTN